ncbi:hypothetical protein F5Y18DRAFT_354757 [Xylariaceae sp. FL1019]|nr:hypothetical protein F5Y18DRAFT_354757 [Xylariaceae sp. FL1019]
MHLPHILGLFTVLLADGVQAYSFLHKRQTIPTTPCTQHLMVDNFAGWSNGLNLLQGATSDDATMMATSTDDGSLTFTPNNTGDSYIYEQFDCINATALGYDSLSFEIKGPEAASVGIELQTKTSCNSTELQSTYYTVNDLSGSLQTINVPLNSFDGANLQSIVGVLWYGFSAGVTGTDTQWRLVNLQILCAGVAPPTDPPPTSTTLTTSTPTASGGITSTVTVTVTATPTTTALPTSTPATTTTTQPTTTTPLPTTTTCLDDWGDDCDDWGWGKREAKTAIASASDAPTCQNALIDDWISQSRLTFLGYNAMLQASSDDGTMKSVVVVDNKVTFTPQDTDSYFYSQFGCFEATAYGGIALRIKAAKGSSFNVQLSSSKDGTCDGSSTKDATLTTSDLGWKFDGTEQLYSIPFTKYPSLDYTKLTQIVISGLESAVTLGPVDIYCGTTPSEYKAPPVVEPTEPTATQSAPASKATTLLIDNFANKETNALGQWHGTDDETLKATFSRNTMTLKTNDSDLQWQTQVAETCRDLTEFDGSYLHIAYSGSNKFSIALQQHNDACNNDKVPYPATWDSLEASRYATDTDIYIPMTHFAVDRTKSIGFSVKGFYTQDATTFSKIEIIPSIPASITIPVKLPSGTFITSCVRPNSFAFAIDDGDPVLAQDVMRTVEANNISVTFFTVGLPLLDPSNNLSTIYLDMASRGHQIALHSYTHPPLEGLPSESSIDWEYTSDLSAMTSIFGSTATQKYSKYFRPPFGTEGARMRQRYAAAVPDPYIVQWSVDVEDWLWAETSTPEKQLAAFKRDVAAGGSITVMHYLYNSTVGYLQEFIDIAKASGKQLMRVDQCMMDPDAPPL